MSAPRCGDCRHLVGGQCDRLWPDGSGKMQQIVIKQADYPGRPADHVFRFWCQGHGFDAVPALKTKEKQAA